LRVSLIGELTLESRGRSLPLPASRKTRALFVYLLLSRNRVRRERLCELFFDVPDDPRAALRWSLSKIRAMLGEHADALVADRERVELKCDAIVTDLDELEAWLADPSTRTAQQSLEMVHAALEAPLAGHDLAGLPSFSDWLAAERGLIARLRTRVFARAASHPAFTPEQQRRFLHEAEANGFVSSPPPLPSARQLAAAVEPRAASAELDQQIHYTSAPDGVRIAYACTGTGPFLVKAANWLNHLELDWTGPVWGRLFSALSQEHRFVRYDERGNGLSDWSADISFEAFVSDLETVVDELKLERFPLLGISQGCAVSIEYAARHPERVSHLILLGGYAAGWRHTATAQEEAQREAIITLAQHGWGGDNPVYRQIFSQTFMPSATKEELNWFNEFQRRTTTPANAVRFLQAFSMIDVRHRLAELKCPTLVLHARADQRVTIDHGLELASLIGGATLVTLDTDSHIPLSREAATERIIACIHSFLGPAPPEAPAPHWQATRL
jgi:pimeloyl-ACP methyl ester carboxylesterase